MTTLEFAREIERANRRLVELRRASRDANAVWVTTALAELSSALEELKVAEEELASQNEELAAAQQLTEHQRHLYQELFMGSPYGQLLTDASGVISEGNRAAGDLLGIASAALEGKPLALFVVKEDRERFSHWVAVLRDASHDATVCAECGGSAEFRMQTASRGRIFPCEVIAAPLADHVKRITTIRWSLRDLTDRDRARDAEQLRDEARRKDEFLAVLGHELRNPLAAISLAANILTGANSDEARKRWAAEVVHRLAEQLGRLVGDLLDVSRVSHGKIALQPHDLDLRQVVAAAVDTCEPSVKGKGHHLSLVLPEEPLRLHADAARLTQVITNLVDNAAKFTPSGGHIEVAVRNGDGQVEISVSDDGIGLAPDVLEQIFGAYHQVEGSAAPDERGLGLGLALVRELVTLHGGSVRAASDGEGRGATFTVELPVQPAVRGDGRAAGEKGDGVGKAANNGHRVLVVDDNSDAAELLAERLRRAGYATEVAFDGKGALAAARHARCQVALVDLGLPDMDGFEVCRQLRQEHPTLRVVALTGYSDSASREQATAVGFDRFLVKPLDLRAVASTVAELVGSDGK